MTPSRAIVAATLAGTLIPCVQASAALPTNDAPPLIQSGSYPHPFSLREKPRAPSTVQIFPRGGPEEAFVDRIQSSLILADEIATEMVLIFMEQGESGDADISVEAEDAAVGIERLRHDLQAAHPPSSCRGVAAISLNLLREMESFYRAAAKGDHREAYKALLKAKNAYPDHVTARAGVKFTPAHAPGLMRQLTTNDCSALVAAAIWPRTSMEIIIEKEPEEKADDETSTPERSFEYAHRTNPQMTGLWKILSRGKYSSHLATVYLNWRSEMQSGYFGASNWSVIPNRQYNQVRFRTIAIVRAYLRDHPTDPVALAQKDFLLYLPNIPRGGLFGNDNVFYPSASHEP